MSVTQAKRNTPTNRGLDFKNSTELSSARLETLVKIGMAGWAVGSVMVKIRYSRTTDFSGTCFYTKRRIHVNLGRKLTYPYRMASYLARAKTVGRSWYKPGVWVELADGYQVVMFIFMHELYHLLVKRSGRNVRQKESMCDRFAARFVVDRFGAGVYTSSGILVPRESWDYQDLNGFVGAARDKRYPIDEPQPRRNSTIVDSSGQLRLFAH